MLAALRASTLGPLALAAGLCAGPATEREPVTSAAPETAVSDTAALDVLGYRISLELGTGSSFRAVAEITARVTTAGGRARFDLVGLVVDSTTVDGARAEYRREKGDLFVGLGRRAAVGDTIVVTVHYGGAPDDGLIIKRNIYDRPTVFADNWPNRARHWFPGIDHPSDKATVEFRVRVPARWSVVAVGRLVSESELPDGRRLWVWATDRPIPVYTMVLGAGELVERELGMVGCDDDAASCVRITQWTFAEDEETAARLFQRAPAIVAFFDSLLGPFPYEKLALVQSSTRFGGMENSSAIFLPERLNRRRSADGLLAHEIAHQWFGDAVTAREWPHVWLSEGFASYFENVFFELVDGDSVGAARRQGDEAHYLESGSVERPLIDEEPENLFEVLNANTYQKGAWVLHMLRQAVGDEAFFEGVRRYYRAHLHGTALSADLRQAMEEVSGQELGWFFDQWLERPGYPEVEVTAAWDGTARALRIRIAQIQQWPPFRFPLELEVEGEGYSLRRTVWVAERESRLEWQLPGAPVRIVADPENAVLGTTKVRRADERS